MKQRLLMLAFTTLSAALVGCSGGPATGAERGACFPNNTCNAGLTCLSNVCVNASSDGGTDVATTDVTAADSSPDATSDVTTGSDVVADDTVAMDATNTADAADVAAQADVATGTDVFIEGGIPCPGASIFHPGSECRMVGSSVPFVGYGRTATCMPITGRRLAWTDSLEGAIGTGEMFNYRFTMIGSHTVTLTATDPGGGTYTASVTFPIQAACP